MEFTQTATLCSGWTRVVMSELVTLDCLKTCTALDILDRMNELISSCPTSGWHWKVSAFPSSLRKQMWYVSTSSPKLWISIFQSPLQWSYGVTMWEVFSGGQNPYPGVDVVTLVKFLQRGSRLDAPVNAACTTEMWVSLWEWQENHKIVENWANVLIRRIPEKDYSIYNNSTPYKAMCLVKIFVPHHSSSAVMQRCWLADSEERPSFTDLSSIMDAMLSSVSDYAELNMKLPHNSQDPIIGDQWL